jgi:hypothetical protein
MAMWGFPTRLSFNFIIGDSLLAVHTLADPTVHCRHVGVVAARPSASDDAVSLKHHLATVWLTIGDNSHTPRITGLFGQPAGVQQRRFAATMGTGHLASVDESSMIIFRHIELREKIWTMSQGFKQLRSLFLGQGRKRGQPRHFLFYILQEPPSPLLNIFNEVFAKAGGVINRRKKYHCRDRVQFVGNHSMA